MDYRLQFKSILKRVVELERSRDSNNQSPDGAWGVYQEQRDARHGKRRWRYFVVNGPFNLLLFASLLISGFAIFNLFPLWGFVVYLICASVFFVLIISFQIPEISKKL